MGRGNLRKRQDGRRKGKRAAKSYGGGSYGNRSYGGRPSYGGGGRGGGGGFNRPPREMHKATCAECGKECEVPFKPDGRRPVYCRECFNKRREY